MQCLRPRISFHGRVHWQQQLVDVVSGRHVLWPLQLAVQVTPQAYDVESCSSLGETMVHRVHDAVRHRVALVAISEHLQKLLEVFPMLVHEARHVFQDECPRALSVDVVHALEHHQASAFQISHAQALPRTRKGLAGPASHIDVHISSFRMVTAHIFVVGLRAEVLLDEPSDQRVVLAAELVDHGQIQFDHALQGRLHAPEIGAQENGVLRAQGITRGPVEGLSELQYGKCGARRINHESCLGHNDILLATIHWRCEWCARHAACHSYTALRRCEVQRHLHKAMEKEDTSFEIKRRVIRGRHVAPR